MNLSLCISFFSIVLEKKNKDEKPPAGRKTLMKFRFKKRTIASLNKIFVFIAENEATYINPCKIKYTIVVNIPTKTQSKVALLIALFI